MYEPTGFTSHNNRRAVRNDMRRKTYVALCILIGLGACCLALVWRAMGVDIYEPYRESSKKTPWGEIHVKLAGTWTRNGAQETYRSPYTMVVSFDALPARRGLCLSAVRTVL
jgi:hypothetical protein